MNERSLCLVFAEARTSLLCVGSFYIISNVLTMQTTNYSSHGYVSRFIFRWVIDLVHSQTFVRIGGDGVHIHIPSLFAKPEFSDNCFRNGTSAPLFFQVCEGMKRWWFILFSNCIHLLHTSKSKHTYTLCTYTIHINTEKSKKKKELFITRLDLSRILNQFGFVVRVQHASICTFNSKIKFHRIVDSYADDGWKGRETWK